MDSILYFNRYTNAVEEEPVIKKSFLKFLYTNPIGQLSLWMVIKRKWFSKWIGMFAQKPISVRKIKPFVWRYGIKSASFEKKISEFVSFNDFFTRKLKPSARPITPKPDAVASPVDGRHLAYQRLNDLGPVFIKGEKFDIKGLILNNKIAQKFLNGSVLISRLSPLDYHRFHFPLDGIPEKTFRINGYLESVSPLALRGRLRIFLENFRMSTILHTEKAGDVLIIEIGATNVGSISQTFSPGKAVLKGQEKGYFNIGGSTVLTFFEPGRIRFSQDILDHTAEGKETYILMGDEVGTVIAK